MTKTFYIFFSFFLGQSGSLSSVSKEKILEICFQYASLMAFCTCALNRLYLVLNVRTAWLSSTEEQFFVFPNFIRRLIKWSIHGKLYFVLVIFVGINLLIATRTSDLKLTHISFTDIY